MLAHMLLKPTEQLVNEAKEDLDRFPSIDPAPLNIRDYDEGTLTAASIASIAEMVHLYANRLVAERNSKRDAFLEAIARRAERELA